MSHDSTDETSMDNFWPELTADAPYTQSVPRSVTLDTVRATSDGRILEVSSQLDLIRTRLNSLEQFVLEAPLNSTIDANIQDRIAEMELSIISTSTRFDELANRLVESDETVAKTVVSSVDGFDTRIALIEDARLGQARELNELTGYLEQAFTRITELAEIIETNNELHTSRIAEVEGQLEDTQTRASLSALETTVADIERRSGESDINLQQRLADLQEAATAPLVELQGRVEAHADRLVQHGEQIQGVEAQTQQHSERLAKHEEELGLQYQDIASLQSFEKATVTQFETHTETLETLGNTLETHTTQIETNSQEIAEIHSRLDASQTDQQQVETSKTVDDVATLARNNADRLSSLAHTADVMGQRIDLTESAGQETAQLVESQVEALDQLENRLDQLENDGPTVQPVADTAQLEATHSRIAEVESKTSELSDALQTESDSLRDEMSNLSERIDDLDTSNDTAPTLAAAPIANEDRVNEIANSAQEAQALAESLRVLQAQVVQTVQGELNTQETRLADVEKSQSEALEAHESFASAERLEQLETKLVEALQTISQLTQLQRRHTGVETQLADALSASNQGIEHTQQHVVLLRSELEKANVRIAHLEHALSSVTGQPAPAPTTTATPAASTQTAATPPPVPGSATPATPSTPPTAPTPSDATVDTGWFDESYDQRQAS